MDIPLWFAGYFALLMFSAALNARALGASIVAALCLVALYPNYVAAGLVTVLFIPAYVLATFRE